MSRLYQAFHGLPPARSRKIKVRPLPKRVWALGHAVEIRYAPYYLGEPGQHKNVLFVHKFGDKGSGVPRGAKLPILAVTESGDQLILIPDNSDYYVSERGIIG